MGSQLKPVAEEERKRLLLGRKPASLGTKMGVFGGRITTVLVLVLMAHAGLAENFFTPSKCVSTIVSCCNPDQPQGQHPFRCFLHWIHPPPLCISLQTPGIKNPPAAGDSHENLKKPCSAFLVPPGVLR